MRTSRRLKAALTALLVTVLWSSSWILIKIGLQDIPALTFAGLRYGLAFFCLLPFALRSDLVRELRGLSRTDGLRLAALGLLCYALTQGLQFVSLKLLPAMTTSLILSFTSLFVAGLGVIFLREKPGWRQWAGGGLALCGALIYLLPVNLQNTPLTGFLAAGACLLANAFTSILGRAVNRSRAASSLTVTVISMGIGGFLLLAVGLLTQGFPALSPANWAIIAWLAAVNSALAFTLWNYSQQSLTAMESSTLNNTMLFQIALIAWLFLDEPLTPQLAFGLLLAGIGTFLVQLRGSPAKS